MTKYETVIGLEFHAELKTKTKIFCSCPTSFAGEPNTRVCPICLGMPGVLPVLNRHAVELAVKAGIALNCEISEKSQFDRKNYFYPDLPKAFQTTQYPLPICRNGYLVIKDAEGNDKTIRINRIHMEEDAGKLVHGGESILSSSYSLPDYNRAAVPLIEIVTEPDISTAEEARAFAEQLRTALDYAGVSDVKMEQGSLRCDVNISLRPEGQAEFGTRTEVKNLNSMRSIERVIKYEQTRQAEVLDDGGRIIQETLNWDDAAGVALPMRSKENAHDYRYFPEPDLPPVIVSREWAMQLASELPEMPTARKERLMNELGLSEYDATQIVANPALAFFFDDVNKILDDAKMVANWLLGDICRILNLRGEEKIIIDCTDFAELLKKVKGGEINNTSAKTVLEEMFATGKPCAGIIKEKGFAQISDTSALEKAADEIIAANPQPVADFKGGKEAALGFLVGQVMKATRGQANAAMVKDLLRKKLS